MIVELVRVVAVTLYQLNFGGESLLQSDTFLRLFFGTREKRFQIRKLTFLFVGLIAGWLAGKIVRGTGFGIIGDILVGIAGALLASLLFPKLGIRIGTGLVSEIVYSTIGAIILLLIVRLVRTGGRL